MDLQLPGLDGYETTARLREREQATGRHLPIVALTAHALEEDRERCLAAGMNGYLAKPIEERELLAVLEAHCPDRARGTPPPVPTLFDRDAFLGRIDGNEELGRELIQLFLEESPKLLEQIDVALTVGDWKLLLQAVHRLKGMVGYFGALAVMIAADEVEAFAQDGKLESASRACTWLVGTVEQLRAGLAAFVDRPLTARDG